MCVCVCARKRRTSLDQKKSNWMLCVRVIVVVINILPPVSQVKHTFLSPWRTFYTHTHAWMHIHRLRHTERTTAPKGHFCSYDWLLRIKDLGKTSGRVTNTSPWLQLYVGDRHCGWDGEPERERERMFAWVIFSATQRSARLWPLLRFLCKRACVCVLSSHLTSHRPLMADSSDQ